jgi:hypothetical protein
MKRVLALVLAAGLTAALAGCGGGDKDKGINKDRDKPRAGEKAG